MAERLKTKLTEKEIDYERLKANLQIAKNTITRLEKEKMMLENKVKSGRYLQSVSVSNANANHGVCQVCNQQKHLETTSLMSDAVSEINHELINALKARIESQQRRIVSMELEGRGSNAHAMEVEKLQEDLSAIQARNIRLEAKNVQLQLDNDLIKQNDNGQRQEARIKHLEE
jgi:centrosomal protein CEP290